MGETIGIILELELGRHGTTSWENTTQGPSHPKSFCLLCRSASTDETTWIFVGSGVTMELWIPIPHVLLMHYDAVAPALVAALPPIVQVPLAPKSSGTMKPC